MQRNNVTRITTQELMDHNHFRRSCIFFLYSDSVYKLQSFALQSNVTSVIPYPQVLCTCSAVLGFCWSSVS